MMPINPEFVLLTISRIQYCIAVLTQSSVIHIQNVSFIALHPVVPSCLSLN